eukprot:21200-Eustigmatos_ZCMA.PRE.1
MLNCIRDIKMGRRRTRKQRAEAEDTGSRIAPRRSKSSKVPKIVGAGADDPTTVVDTSFMSFLDHNVLDACY